MYVQGSSISIHHTWQDDNCRWFPTGSGAPMDNHTTESTWTPWEARMHINLLELRTAWEACKTFLPFIQFQHILLILENIITIFYINEQGCAHSVPLCIEVVNVWNWGVCRTTSFYWQCASQALRIHRQTASAGILPPIMSGSYTIRE